MLAAIKLKLESEKTPSPWFITLYTNSGVKRDRLFHYPLVMGLGFIIRRLILFISVFLFAFPRSILACLVITLLALAFDLSLRPYQSNIIAVQAYLDETLLYSIIIGILIATNMIYTKWLVSWLIICFLAFNYIIMFGAWLRATFLVVRKIINRFKKVKKATTVTTAVTPAPVSESNS